MKTIGKTLITILAIFLLTGVSAQSGYKIIKDIPYYPQSEDQYRNSQCRLDLLVPEGKKQFPVLVWFHGGGLTGGSKDIPEELKKYGVGIVSVEYRQI